MGKTEVTTRIIFTDQLTEGHIILDKCEAYEEFDGAIKGCVLAATTHHPGVPHEFTVLDRRVGGNGTMNAIVVDEDGNQQPWSRASWVPITILA